MKKNNMLLWLLIGLICIALCVVLIVVLVQSDGENSNKDDAQTSQTAEEPEETEPEETEPEETEPEETEPEETEPEETEPEETEPEETEPEETESSGAGTNTPSGGGYESGTTEPGATEPAPTEPTVPAAGSENNAYVEQMSEPHGSFQTVKIPAGQTIYYRLKTPGTTLKIQDESLRVTCNGQEYAPVEGVLEIPLPADGDAELKLQFHNDDAEEKAFAVTIWDVAGSQTNPIPLSAIDQIQTDLPEGANDGIYYQWTADADGILKLSVLPEAGDDVNVIISKGEDFAELQQDDDNTVQMPVATGDQVTIQVLAVAEENAPAKQVNLKGYVAPVLDMQVDQIPQQLQTVQIPGGQSVFYNVIGANGNGMTTRDERLNIQCGDLRYIPEDGEIYIKISNGTADQIPQYEFINTGAEAASFAVNFDYAIGNEKNPHILTQLGELPTVVDRGTTGYHYRYTAVQAGVVTFQVSVPAELENGKTDIVLLNETTGETSGLWSGEEERFTTSVTVMPGDVLAIAVTVTENGSCVDAELTVSGALHGSEELPILVQLPGFTAHIPAGQTLYYEGYNLGGLLFNLESENVTVSHNNVLYTNNMEFKIVAAGRAPALFAITNTGTVDGVYNVAFNYPVGHLMNPDTLVIGGNTVNFATGDGEYCLNFTAPRAGTLTFRFDENAQWCYVADNLTQQIPGDMQYSDSDPLVTVTSVTVEAGDTVQLRVVTYDSMNPWTAPEGSVTFQMEYTSGPVTVTDPSQALKLTMLAGEKTLVTGDLYGENLTIVEAWNMTVTCNGTAYTPDAQGTISLTLPADDGGNGVSFTLENGGLTEQSCTLVFGEIAGTESNPAELVIGSNVAICAAGSDGYYYTFTATKAATMRLIFEEGSNWKLIYKGREFNSEKNSDVLNLGRITKGTTLTLIIMTYDPENPDETPAGTVNFDITFS